MTFIRFKVNSRKLFYLEQKYNFLYYAMEKYLAFLVNVSNFVSHVTFVESGTTLVN